MPEVFTVVVNEVPDLGYTVVLRDRRERRRQVAGPPRGPSINQQLYEIDIAPNMDEENMRGFRTLPEVADYIHERIVSEPIEPEERSENATSGVRNTTAG